LAAASKTAAEAARFAGRLEKDIFQGPEATILAPFVAQFQRLPSQLRALKDLLNVDGKPGSKKEVFVNTFLVTASELVRAKLGKPYDEDLAELYQAIAPRSRELSGDAIRKKRARLRRDYPHSYLQARQMASRAAKTPLQ
jgi:hypothetical protein